MRTSRPLCLLVRGVGTILLACRLQAAVVYAGANGDDAAGAGSPGHSFATISDTARLLKRTEPAFSFLYHGISSKILLPGWASNRTEVRLDLNRRQMATVYTDPQSGLRVTCQATEYLDFAAVEWLLYFENTGSNDTGIIEQVYPEDSVLARGNHGEFKLDSANGCSALVTDFQPQQTALTNRIALTFAPAGGRSSQDTAFPYFNVAAPDGGGEMLAVGWSGQWSASFTRDASTNLNIRAGMQLTHLTLHPGERIRTPAILALEYNGSGWDGHNLLRKFIIAHDTPTPGGQAPVTPIAGSPAGYIGFEDTTQTNMIQAITNIAVNHFPIDTYWIDAGWFLDHGNWVENVGNWVADPSRYPNGMKPVADAAHAHGMKFLLWFEPERVMPGTILHQSHPEWLLSGAATQGGIPCYLLNLGNPTALHWAETNFSAMITNIGIDIYRLDFNMEPLTYWLGHDATNRQGMTEIQYITGLYAFLDSLQTNNPALLIDNCSAAGHRLDFEMARRGVPLLRTDYLWDPVGAQCMEYALSYWLPYQGQGGVAYDPYNFRSGMGETGVYAFNFGVAQDPWWSAGAAAVEQYKSVKPYFMGDFYPLTPYSVSNTVWLAYEFDRPDLRSGLVQVFRRGACPTPSVTLPLFALEANARYAISNFDLPGLTFDYGSNLLRRGLSVTSVSAPGAAIYTYTKAP